MRIGKADRQHEANSLFMHFCEEPYKAASVQAIKAGGGAQVYLHAFPPWHWMEMNGHFRDLVICSFGRVLLRINWRCISQCRQ